MPHPLHQLGRTLRTARHLRPRQLAAQVAYRLRGPARTPRHTQATGVVGMRSAPDVLAPSVEGHAGPQGVALVGRPPHDPLADGWDPGAHALWSYTLHYHGWLQHPECSPSHARATILGWIDEHREGVGWEPYPTSLRVLHWIGWLRLHAAHLQAFEHERIFGSLAAQLEHLAAHVETHIDGNHLWTNLAALTVAGLALRGSLPDRIAARFAPRFVATMTEQLCGDGTHGERTPTYHCVLAEQLAIAHGWAKATDPSLASRLAPRLDAMLSVLPAFTHPDGDVALWGDSQRDAPVTPGGLLSRLGRRLPAGHADAPIGGFARRRFGALHLLWNRGDVGLPYQVGHVHGDALAIEASVGGTRVLVDAGVGTYDIGAERRYARSTAAHNTVTIGPGPGDHHELWASHRIGARASVETTACSDHRIVGRVRAHDGRVVHRRTIEHRDELVRIIDALEGAAPPATARYFVPSTLPLSVEGDTATLVAAGRRVMLRAVGRAWRRDRAPGWVGMGRPSPRVCLSVPVDPGGQVVELWVSSRS